MILKILRLEHNKSVPEYKTEGAAGMDLCAAIDEEITLQPLERKLIRHSYTIMDEKTSINLEL